MTPLVRGNLQKKRKKETNTVLAQIESKFNCKREGTWHLKRTNAKPKNARNNVHLGSDLSSNWPIATSNDKAFHTPYQLSAVEFTRWCLDLWTCSKKSSCYVFFGVWYTFLLQFSFVCFLFFLWFEMTTNINFRYIHLCNILNQQQIFNKQIGWHSLIHVALCGM